MVTAIRIAIAARPVAHRTDRKHDNATQHRYRCNEELVSFNLGIDVGNTYVAVALAKATAVEMFHFDDNAMVTPATVHLPGDGTLAGEAANSPAGSSLDRLGGAFMRRLGGPTPAP